MRIEWTDVNVGAEYTEDRLLGVGPQVTGGGEGVARRLGADHRRSWSSRLRCGIDGGDHPVPGDQAPDPEHPVGALIQVLADRRGHKLRGLLDRPRHLPPDQTSRPSRRKYHLENPVRPRRWTPAIIANPTPTSDQRHAKTPAT